MNCNIPSTISKVAGDIKQSLLAELHLDNALIPAYTHMSALHSSSHSSSLINQSLKTYP